MKKLFKLFSLILTFGLLFTLTACVPSADKAEEKMKEEGYLALDASKFGLANDKCEKVFLFALGDNVIDAGAKFMSGEAEYLTVLYFNELDDAKAHYEEIEKQFDKLEEADKEDLAFARSGKCVYYGKKAAAKAFK